MIFLDFKPGVTISLLLKAIAGTANNGLAPLHEAKPRTNEQLSVLWAKAWAEPTIDEIILALFKGCTGLPPVQPRSIDTPDGLNRDSLAALMTLAGAASIDPFEFSAYISILYLSGPGKAAWRLLTPGIGSDSPESTFSILRDTAVNVSPEAKSITPFLAAVLKYDFSPFAGRAGGGRLVETLTQSDPLDSRSNVRAFYYEDAGGEHDEVAVIEANLDDMSPEILARAMQVMVENGALDFTVAPVGMKKGRSGFRVEVIVRPVDREKIEELLLLHTSTFGVRATRAERRVLERTTEYFESSFGRLRVKRGFYRGNCIKVVPEYEDLAEISAKRGIPLIRLYTDVIAEITRESS